MILLLCADLLSPGVRSKTLKGQRTYRLFAGTSTSTPLLLTVKIFETQDNKVQPAVFGANPKWVFESVLVSGETIWKSCVTRASARAALR